ncbi:MAG: OmpH family outer membrane protein [Tannerella sp.]|jgi:outer membrane protein|nr:OmpH family outer membrane protein [Tannerella sp.]
MKKFIVLMFLLLSIGAYSQELKIAYVNAGEVFNIMPEITDAETKMATIRKQYEDTLKAMTDEHTLKYQEYMKIEATLPENLKLKKQQEIMELQDRYQNYLPVADQEIQQEQEKIYAPIQEKLMNAIKAVGDDQKYTAIFANNPNIVYYVGATAIDATPLVKAKLGLK